MAVFVFSSIHPIDGSRGIMFAGCVSLCMCICNRVEAFLPGLLSTCSFDTGLHRFSCMLLVKNLAVRCRCHSTFRCLSLTTTSHHKTQYCLRVRALVRLHLARCHWLTWPVVPRQNVVSRHRDAPHDDQTFLWTLALMTVLSGCRAVRPPGSLMDSSVALAVRQMPSTWNCRRVFEQISLLSITDSWHTAE